MQTAKSTRLSIVKQGLSDVLERHDELPPSARVRELRGKALSFERVVRGWDTQPPSIDQRAAMTKCVIDLNIEVMSVDK